MRCSPSLAHPSARLILAATLLVSVGCQTSAPPAEFVVAISPDLPPYVMEQASRGIEVELFERIAPEQKLRFVQMPYAELQQAIPERRADAAIGVQMTDGDGVFYSEVFVTFENVAIVKNSAGFTVNAISDMANHAVLTWQGADRELGPSFQKQYAVGAPQRPHYVEFADQREQVEVFWKALTAVIVIDRHVFQHLSAEQGHSMSKVSVAAPFPASTGFRVGFPNAALRDGFDQSLMRICEDESYQAVLDRYHVELEHTPCDR